MYSGTMEVDSNEGIELGSPADGTACYICISSSYDNYVLAYLAVFLLQLIK